MGPSCPRCRNSNFSYRALLSVHPSFGEFSPARINCPACGLALRVTARSRLEGAGGVVISLIGVMVLLGRAHAREWLGIVAATSILAAYYFVFWPIIVRLKPWTPFQYWLPKSRIVGYSLYLLAPVALMILLFYLGVLFGWGM